MNDTTTVATADVSATFDKTVDVKEMKFRWKKDKLGNQRAAIETKGPVPSVEGVIEILQKGGKGLELLLEITYDTVRGAVADFLAENEGATADTIPWANFSWDAIANQPREDRRASSIPQELWTAFAEDYIAIMPGVAGKTIEAVTLATTVYLKKFSIVKTNKEVLTMLKGQIALYMENSKKAEEFSEILDLLIKKVDTYLKADDVQLLVANL